MDAVLLDSGTQQDLAVTAVEQRIVNDLETEFETSSVEPAMVVISVDMCCAAAATVMDWESSAACVSLDATA